MHARRSLLIAALALALALGLAISDVCAALVIPFIDVSHTGVTPQALESAYLEPYEQPGLHQTNRRMDSSPTNYAIVISVPELSHTGITPQALERLYVESYERSGFRLTTRRMEWHPVGYWEIILAFKWRKGPTGPDAPGITLAMSVSAATGCACRMSRASIRGLYQESPDQAIFLRGMDIVAKADAAASVKVRERLGVSLPDVALPPH